MTDRSAERQADLALKERHRAMWAAGDYPELVRDMLTDLGPALVAASGVGAGERVLDVAAGTGNTSIPAAKAGASVVASDLTPELFDAGRKAAADAGVEIEWRLADAEALPFAEAEFDTVLSSIGVMFAPHHQVAADELVRVCRPGGTIGLLSWTPEGFIGQMFATMKPYAPAPPPGAQPPPLWGSEEHVRALLGHRVAEVSASRGNLRVDHFRTPADFRDYFKAHYGPTIVVYQSLADDPAKVAALDRALEELAERHDIGTGGRTVLDWEYLLLTCERV
jgi:ubiquinone/menaquinone biosynthesis C-methylase UbiE